ncbi:hypothetical protein M595_5682 [Lyngbya aestuarii BL J]|uniref:Uncharacterized protein n=1 Tax=Lyngbya aestuarii BL J TaxID=1348334 RepID=U7Q7P5_9CYAN|nr:hypothetical protein M595_6195 [Lyngbya aestuarii BL J]ERT03991.1 hypothetical protein M595_6069 [Lyngbya aestuarii BL J]ERT04363.1 hypothetical protein M595_5682 [Lyngbya aestuarii BL J]
MGLSKARSNRLNTDMAITQTAIFAGIALTGIAGGGYLADCDFNVLATLIRG